MTNSEFPQSVSGNDTESKNINTLNSNSTQEPEGLSIIDLLSMILRRWKFIFFSTLIAAILIVGYSIYTLRMPPNAPFNELVNFYTPEVLVRVQDDQANTASLFGSSNSGLSALAGLAGNSGGVSSSVALAQELLKSNTILDQIAAEFDLIERYNFVENPMHSARVTIAEKLKTTYNSGSGTLLISYTDSDPILATQIVNRAVALLEKRFKNLTMSKILNKKLFLEERLATVEDDLKEAQTNLINFQIETGIVNVVVNKDTGTTELVFNEYKQPTQRHVITLKYFDLERDKKILEGIYELLMNQYESTKIEEMDDSKTFQILEVAEVPVVKAGPSRGRICIMVTLTVFLASLALSLFFEYIRTLKKDPEKAEKLKELKNSITNRSK